MGVTTSKARTAVKASSKRSTKAQGIVVTKTFKGLKFTDHGVSSLSSSGLKS